MYIRTSSNVLTTQIVLTSILFFLILGVSNSLDLNPVIYGIKFSVFILGVIFLILKNARLPRSHFPLIIFFLFCFVFTITVSTLSAGEYTDSGLLNLALIVTLFFYIFLYSSERDNGIICLYRSIKICLSVFILLSVCLIFFKIGYMDNGRYVGTFSHPNGAGSCSSLLLIICVIDYLNKKNITDLVLSIASFVVLALSQSRTSIVAVALSILVFLLITKKVKLLIFYLIFVCLFIIGYVASLSFIDGLTVRDMTESTGRENFVPIYLEMFKENPIIGVGLCHRYKTEIAYFDIIASSGFLGFIFFLAAIMLSLFKGFKYSKYLDELRPLTYMYMCILLLSVGDGYVSNIGHPVSMFFWLYIAAIAKLQYTSCAKNPK